jgi:glycogen(starch) synthase
VSIVRLLIYSHFFSPSIGGVETIVRSLASGLATLRNEVGVPLFEVTVVTETPSQGSSDQSWPFRVLRNPSIKGLYRLIQTCDVIHIAGPALLPIMLGLMFRKPTVVEHHGFQSICPNGQLLIEPTDTPCPGHFMARNHRKCLACNAGSGWLQSCKLWLLTFVRRFLCRRVSRNVTPTAWLSDLVSLPKVETIWHGLEHRSVPSIRYDRDRPLIVFQGRLVTTKGVRVLAEAARLLRIWNCDFELLIIGDGPERTGLETLFSESELSERVRFAGRLPDAEVEKAIGSASVVVVPSLGGEVFGLVIAENMQRGLAVVASDLGAFREVLGETGITFRTGDPADLASKLQGLLHDPLLTLSTAQSAKRRCERLFCCDAMIQGHADLYRALAG